MFGLRWFGPKKIGMGIGPRTWQAWAVVALCVAGLVAVHLSVLPGPLRHQLSLVVLGLLIAIMLLTYSPER
jgi:hypothetical protein